MKYGWLFVIVLVVLNCSIALGDTDEPVEYKAEIDLLKQYDGFTVQKIIDDITLDYEKQMEVIKWESQRDVVFPLIMEIEYLKKHIRDYGQIVMAQEAINSIKNKKINNYKEIMAVSWVIFFTAGIVIGLIGIKTLSTFVSAIGSLISRSHKRRKKYGVS